MRPELRVRPGSGRLNQLEDGTARPDPYGWITALRAPAIRKLMAEDGPLQLSLFDQQDLAEITSGDFHGERLVACRNPVLSAERARKREDLLAATEKLLAPVLARVRSGKLAERDFRHIKADDLDPRPVFHYGQPYRSFRGLLQHLAT